MSAWVISLTFLVVLVMTSRIIPSALAYYGNTYFPDVDATPDNWWQQIFATFAICGFAAFICRETANLTPWMALIMASLYGVTRCDLRYQIIPDRFHLIGGLAVLGYMATQAQSQQFNIYYLVYSLLISLTLPLGLYLLNVIYARVRNQVGLGFGDIKLLFWLAPLIGSDIYYALFLACGMAIIVQIPSLWKNRTWFKTFAFGPYIVVSSVALLVLSYA